MAKSPEISAGLIFALLLTWLLSFEQAMCAAPPVQPTEASTTGTQLLAQAQSYYESGQLDEAEYVALKALEAPGMLTKQEQSDLYVVLAFCAIANDDEVNGQRHFVSALKFNPNLKPDPIAWSPKVKRIFDRARADWIQISRLDARRHVSMEAEICRRAAFRSMILPGSGQLYKQHHVSGWTQGALFWGSFATAIYCQAILPSLRDKYLEASEVGDITSKYNRYRNVSRAATISGSIAFTIYSYSLFDALWREPDASLLEENAP